MNPPAVLRGTLRPYQAQGAAWLRFPRSTGLGGMLTDDMGLGKMVQTLAHLAIEQAAGRLDRPALIVCPTSLVPNWTLEAERFAPGLKLLSLHGPTVPQELPPKAEIAEPVETGPASARFTRGSGWRCTPR